MICQEVCQFPGGILFAFYNKPVKIVGGKIHFFPYYFSQTAGNLAKLVPRPGLTSRRRSVRLEHHVVDVVCRLVYQEYTGPAGHARGIKGVVEQYSADPLPAKLSPHYKRAEQQRPEISARNGSADCGLSTDTLRPAGPGYCKFDQPTAG